MKVKIPLLREAIQTTVSEVWYCEHRMDNSFLRHSFEETEKQMQIIRYFPEGICLRPSYREDLGYGLKFIDENGEEGWVHVSKKLMYEWLKQLDLMPPNDVPWNWEIIEKYVWRRI